MSQCISDKLCYGHGRCELLSQVVEGIRCIQPEFNHQMLEVMTRGIYLLLANKFQNNKQANTITACASVTK